MSSYRFDSKAAWLRAPAMVLTLAGGLTLTLPYPRCACCMRAVDLLTAVDSPAAGEVLLTSFCHARREQVRVPRHLLLGEPNLHVLEAFAAGNPIATDKVLC